MSDRQTDRAAMFLFWAIVSATLILGILIGWLL